MTAVLGVIAWLGVLLLACAVCRAAKQQDRAQRLADRLLGDGERE